MATSLTRFLSSNLGNEIEQVVPMPCAFEFDEELHPEFLTIRGEDWRAHMSHGFDPVPPLLDEGDPDELMRTAWRWSQDAWRALLAPQLETVRTRTIRETEPFTFGYLSGVPSALVSFLGAADNRWLAGSIMVGPYADVFGPETLFEAHQLCALITAAGDDWPTATRLNSFDTGWKAGYVEMIDLLSGDWPEGLLGRFLREGFEPPCPRSDAMKETKEERLEEVPS